jgi:hypothetical protein
VSIARACRLVAHREKEKSDAESDKSLAVYSAAAGISAVNVGLIAVAVSTHEPAWICMFPIGLLLQCAAVSLWSQHNTKVARHRTWYNRWHNLSRATPSDATRFEFSALKKEHDEECTALAK